VGAGRDRGFDLVAASGLRPRALRSWQVTRSATAHMLKAMAADAWTDRQNDEAVASYMAMLSDELCGRPFNKAASNRDLQQRTGRPRGAIEFKLCNISAVAQAFGLPTILGYRPRFNFQMSLAGALSRWLAQNPEWEAALHRTRTSGMAERAPLFIETAPTLRNTPPPEELEQTQAVARRFDVAGRDARNRALGLAGEELVLQFERGQLRQMGRDDLARRVRWTSREDGDGAGYDIESFTVEGRPRLIEVKTTNGWERTPFFVSRNEIEVSRERRDHWHLFRLFNLARAPRAFELRPPLEAHVSLTATEFMAGFEEGRPDNVLLT